MGLLYTSGCQIYTGCEVHSIEEHEQGITAHCKDVVFRGRRMAVCTNAFANRVLKEHLDIVPGRGMVMSIQPELPLRVSGTFHYDEGYYYFRDYYGKLIFGGGRNVDIEAEQTDVFGINEDIKSKLIADVEEIILPNQAYTIEDIWSGIMAFGQNKAPIIEKISENLVIGVRLGGMGVAIGSLVGEELTNMLLDLDG